MAEPIPYARRIFYLVWMFVFVQISHAGVYKWVDEDGVVHFGDKEGSGEHLESADLVEIKEHLTVNRIPDIEPIQYASTSGPSSYVAFNKLRLALPKSENGEITVGQVQVGEQCSRGAAFKWKDGKINLEDKYVYSQVINTFQDAGYQAGRFVPNAGLGSGYVLKGNVIQLKVNICAPTINNAISAHAYRGRGISFLKAKSAISLKIKWELTQVGKDRIVKTLQTEGYHSNYKEEMRPIIDSVNESFELSLGMSVRHLLANKDFIGLLEFDPKMSAVPVLSSKAKHDDQFQVSIAIGNRSSRFVDVVPNLKQSAVTIKSNGGHGSGVIIDPRGFVLTNAHVVSDLKEVAIELFGGKSYRGRVIRKHDRRDVALIKLVMGNEKTTLINSLESAPVSNLTPGVGEELYVIGTPLNESLSHTVTKGIYSSPRTIEGQSYYQTDASINPGNSGGPVFNTYGNLVAISVAGIFTSDGAGISVNYVIPIEEVLASLDIEKDSSVKDIGAQFTRYIRTGEGGKHLLEQVKAWLNEPVFSF